MRLHSTAFALALLTLPSVLGCGGEPPAQAPVAQASAPPPAPPPPPDLSPVQAPASLVVSGRLSRPSASLATVHGWTKLPMPQSEQVTEILTSEAVGPIVDLDQPIDFAVAVSGVGPKMKDLTAVSAAVKDPDKVKASLSERYKLVQGDNGALLVQGLGKPRGGGEEDEGDGDGKPDPDAGRSVRTCELAPAFGDAPVRIVCAWSPRALTELAPWLTRTATRAPASGDLHVEVKMGPLRPTIAEQKRLIGMIAGGVVGSRMGLSSLRGLAAALGTDLADFATDLEGATADVTLADAGAQLSFLLQLSGRESSLGRVLTARAERSGPPPAAFWQLPADADFASFNRGIDEPELAKARTLLQQVTGDLLGDAGVKGPERKSIVGALGKLLTSSPIVYGSGLDEGAVRKALDAQRAVGSQAEAHERAEARRQAAEALLGWHVLEVDEPPAAIAGAVKDLAAALSRPSVVAAFHALDKDTPPPTMHTVPVARAAGLPAGTTHYVLEIPVPDRHPVSHVARGGKPAPPKKPAPAARPLQVHLYVVGQGDHAWLAVGGDDAVTAARLASALGAGSGERLSGRADLAALKDAKIGAGGFFTVRGVPEGVEEIGLLVDQRGRGASETFEETAQLPHRGLSPLLFSVTSQAGAPAVAARVDVPRDAIEDVVTAVLKHGGF